MRERVCVCVCEEPPYQRRERERNTHQTACEGEREGIRKARIRSEQQSDTTIEMEEVTARTHC